MHSMASVKLHVSQYMELTSAPVNSVPPNAACETPDDFRCST